MKKFILAVMAVTISASFAFAAVSVPCSGYRKPKAPEQPRQPVEEGFRRDVLDNRVPVQTEEKGTVHIMEATKDRETLISGQQ